MIIGTYDLRLVALSLLIAVLASYTALELAARVTLTQGLARIIWLTGGATIMGIGIWSMHFVGMLAFSLPVPIDYDVPTVLLSMLAAVIASFAALLLASRSFLSQLQLVGGSVFMGGAIALMHYIGMVAMHTQALLHYNYLLVALSVGIAISASYVALWLAFQLRDQTSWNWHKLMSSVVMGGAIGGMHYTAMAAAHFTLGLGFQPLDYTLKTSTLALVIGITTLVILGLTLLISLVNQRRSVQLKAQELLQNLILKMHVGVLLLGSQWEIHLSNPAACILLGRTESQLLNTTAFSTDWDVIRSDDTPFLNETFSMPQLLQTKCGLQNVVVGIYRPNTHDRVWLLVNAEPQFAADGSVEQVICTLSDVTERKQAEELLRRTNSVLKAQQEAAIDGIFLVDENRQVMSYNQRYEQMWQIPDHVMKSGDAREVLSFMLLSLKQPQEYLDRVEFLYAHPHEQSRDEIYLNDGRIFDRYSAPVLSPEGSLTFGRIWYDRDITERKQAESERLQLANHIKLLLESTDEGIYGIDLQGYCTFINTAGAKMLGYKPDEVIGRDMHKLVHHSYSNSCPYPNGLCPIFQAFRMGQSCHVDSEVLWHSDGTAFAAEYSSYPIIESLEIKGAVVTFRDVTQRRQAEEALRHSETQLREQATKLEHTLHELRQTQAQLIQTEKMSSLGQMVAGMAHEINNPISFVYGNIQYTKEYIQDLLKLLQLYEEQYPRPTPAIQAHFKDIDLEFIKDDLPKMLHSMEMGAERICSLVLSLRNFSRLDEAQVKPVDLHEGIDSTLLILNHYLKTGITISKQYDDLPLVECYPDQINQVFMNLLSNAIDALEESLLIRSYPVQEKSLSEGSIAEISSYECFPAKETGRRVEVSDADLSLVRNKGEKRTPTIHIRTEVIKPNLVRIHIADNGRGIPLEILNKIFDPFFTTKPVGKGTGLGLSICYQIIEKHQGQLSVNSQIGQGTEFVITLPIKCEQEYTESLDLKLTDTQLGSSSMFI
ncbi:MAG: MHYT domain-containing protein [Rhizonema sp. NSF051]|nr:MHYT domain-containing protein [Rhizonema sp. NSF051]